MILAIYIVTVIIVFVNTLSALKEECVEHEESLLISTIVALSWPLIFVVALIVAILVFAGNVIAFAGDKND